MAGLAVSLQMTHAPFLANSAIRLQLTGPRIAVGIFFAVYLLVGLAIVDDYGASWDEPINRNLGKRSYNFIKARLSGDQTPASELLAGGIAEQGPFFEIILFAVEDFFAPDNARDVVRMRHTLTFLVFWGGSGIFYLLLRMRFGDRTIAILGTLFLILSPRIFAHSFFNSKDTILLASFTLSTYTLLRYLRDARPRNASLHALACAATIDIRVVGLILPAVTLLFLGIEFARRRSRREFPRKLAFSAATYLLLLVTLVILFWPQLWESPWESFLRPIVRINEATQFNNHFALYRGQFIDVSELPWHYLPVWMLITIPFGYTLLFLAGLGAALSHLWNGTSKRAENEQNLLATLLFLLPILFVILFRPVLYDGWRHFYFTYPAFLMIALLPLRELAARRACEASGSCYPPSWSCTRATPSSGIIPTGMSTSISGPERTGKRCTNSTTGVFRFARGWSSS